MSINIKKKALNVKNGDTYDNFDMFFLGDVEEAVDDWFEEHPDGAVPDGSLTLDKFKDGELPFVTPEMFGAKGDGVTDDIDAITACFNYEPKHVLMAGRYYISEPITNITNGTLVDGGGTILAETAGIVLESARGIVLRNLTINYVTFGIRLTSTEGYSDYCSFYDIVINGSDSSSSIGVSVEQTGRFNNEHRFTNVVVWNSKIGFRVYNTNENIECNSHRFLFCSAESTGDCGFYFENSSFDSMVLCRIEEGNGAKVKTTGVCNRLTIITDSLIINGEQRLSNHTNGVVLGNIRSGLHYIDSPGGYATIKNGKIIPCKEMLPSAFEEQSLNSDVSAPKIENNTIYIYNSWNKFGSNDTTLTLDPAYYGGAGRINDIDIFVGEGAGSVTVTDGTVTKVLPKDNSSSHLYHLSFFYTLNARKWRVIEYDLSI